MTEVHSGCHYRSFCRSLPTYEFLRPVRLMGQSRQKVVSASQWYTAKVTDQLSWTLGPGLIPTTPSHSTFKPPTALRLQITKNSRSLFQLQERWQYHKRSVMIPESTVLRFFSPVLKYLKPVSDKVYFSFTNFHDW